MPDSGVHSAAERFAVALLLVFLVAFGWFTLLNGGVALKGKSAQVVEVSGRTGIAVALGCFALAVVILPLFARVSGLQLRSSLLVAAIIALPPLGFLVLRL